MAASQIRIYIIGCLWAVSVLSTATEGITAQELPISGPGGKPVAISSVSGDKIFDRLKSASVENIGFWLVDLRTEAEFYKKFIPGAINIPYKKLSFMAEKIFMPTDNIVFYGYPGSVNDAINACTFMKQKGFDNCMVLENGIDGWPGYYEKGISN